MRTYSHHGLTFDLDDSGPADGEPIVLLHGFPQNRSQWRGVTPVLTEAGYRVLAPDQRGYSPLARPRARRDYRISELVDDVVALVDALGVEQAHVVGHDWGAQVAWSLASKHPERVRTLTALSVPHPQAFTAALRGRQALKSWYMLLFQVPAVPERLVPTARARRLVGGDELTPEQVAQYLAPLGRDGLTGALNWYRALPYSQRESGYGRSTRVPTTFIWGAQDPALGRVGAEATAGYVQADYRFEEIAGAGHWLADQHPQRVAELVLERVRTQPPA